jgi:hypothetical protein
MSFCGRTPRDPEVLIELSCAAFDTNGKIAIVTAAKNNERFRFMMAEPFSSASGKK